MGCIKRIIQIIILIFAYIGFQSIGGLKYCQDFINNVTNPSPEKTVESANKIINTSKLSEDYTIAKVITVFGLKVVEVDYNKAPQKIFLVDSNGLIKLSKEDFYSGKIEDILQDLINKFTYQAIRLENLKILRMGHFMALNNQKIPYVLFEADVIRGTTPKIYGMLGVSEDKEAQTDVILSFTTTCKYSQKITEDFFHQVNYAEENNGL